MLSEAYGPTSCTYGIVPESTLSHKPEVQNGFVPKLSQHEWQKPSPFGLKNIITTRSRFYLFSPLVMFSVARQRVVMSGLVLGACSQAQSHDVSTKAHRAKTSAEGF